MATISTTASDVIDSVRQFAEPIMKDLGKSSAEAQKRFEQAGKNMQKAVKPFAQPLAKSSWKMTDKAVDTVVSYLPSQVGSMVEKNMSQAKTWFDANIMEVIPNVEPVTKTEAAAKSTAKKATKKSAK